jgi:tetratricopeptide (TPR) repeat protein
MTPAHRRHLPKPTRRQLNAQWTRDGLDLDQRAHRFRQPRSAGGIGAGGLESYRLANDLSQTDVAAEYTHRYGGGTTASIVSRWEAWPDGHKPIRPSVEVLQRLAVICHTTAPTLLAAIEERPPSHAISSTVAQATGAVEAAHHAGLPVGAAHSQVADLRLGELSADQLLELLAHLREQWHLQVKTDNLLGPRYALVTVHGQLPIIEAILDVARDHPRAEALQLAAQYAESAAWLHEDVGQMPQARYWTSRAMEWAQEADDRLMVAWTLFRRSQHARAEGRAAPVISLAQAARRPAQPLLPPMLAAITQQEAQGHALDGDERQCHRLLDKAHELAASVHEQGDARAGHGSFCTPGYIEMQRGGCWLVLGKPQRAVASYQGALDQFPAVYRRDRGVALAGLAAAYAVINEPEQAAVNADQALRIARNSGSSRILNSVRSVAQALKGHKHPAVTRLLHALAEPSTS